MAKAQIGDVMKVDVRQPHPRTIIITLTTQKQADYANELLSDPASGWQLERAIAPCPNCQRLRLELAISNDLGQRVMDQLKALEPRPASPALRAYDEAMQAAGVPREPLEVYTSNSWRRVGLASRHHIVMAPTVWSDGHPDIDCPVMLTALVAAYNAMLELRKPE